MNRYLRLSLVATLLMTTSCMWRVNMMHPLIRSEVVRSKEIGDAIVAKAHLMYAADGKTKVLFLRGTPYERGFQQGVLLKDDIQKNLTYLYDKASSKYGGDELFDETYERMRPYIPQEYIDEMRGLAHGAQIPLRVVHGFHALPSVAEWGGKKEIADTAKKMFWGELGTSCSNFSVCDSATADKQFYAIRMLDWGLHRISRTHEFPLITITVPETGLASANIGWSGFLGSVSGMNEAGITLGEMGYGNPPNETLRGEPMPFMLRDVMRNAHNLQEARDIVKNSPPDCSFIYLFADGKTKETEMIIRDKDRFLVFKPTEPIQDGKNKSEKIEDTMYGGHYNDVMTELLKKYHGTLTPKVIMTELIPKFAMDSNFQNVIYDPVNLKFWVSNAKGPKERAADQPYLEFDFGTALNNFRQGKFAATTATAP